MRHDTDTLKRLAREFTSNWRADIWNPMGRAVQDALVDSYVMDHVRMAAAVNADLPMTPADLVDFRERLVAAMRLDPKCRRKLIGMKDLS
jgi:hypothetical protein